MGSNLWVVLGLGVAGIYVLLRRPLSGKPARDKHGAFVQYLELRPPPLRPPPAGAPASLPPPLTGLFFAVKDIFDIEGFVTGFGSPAWRSTHDPAYRTAHAVAELVKAGAVCVGKTHMDEMAYSINGENCHYGTPDNPVAPGRVPGGSSSGSAVAVAGGHVDFALGTDTGGSVRVPAAYCGVLGFRPSHGAVSTVGVVPMAQSFDTVGWFARDPLVLRAVGQVLLGPAYGDPRPPRRFLVADDLFKVPSFSQDRVLALVTKGIERVFGEGALAHTSVGDYLAATVPSLALKLQQLQRQQQRAGDGVVGLAALRAVRDALRRIQAFEFRTNHEQWLAEAQPGLGPGTAERVRAALETEADVALSDAQQVKKEVQAAITGLLKGDVVLVLPTVPGPPPRKNTKVSQLDDFRARAFTLLSLAGMSGCCQVSLPLGKLDGLPASVSFIARPGSDHFLLDTVVSLVLSRPNQWKGHSDH